MQTIGDLQTRIADLEAEASDKSGDDIGIKIEEARTITAVNNVPSYYEAIADAVWSATRGVWQVSVQGVEDDGTLGANTQVYACIGAESDTVPMLSGERCIEALNDDGRVVLVAASQTPCENDHSWHFTAVDDTTGDVTPGTGWSADTQLSTLSPGTIDCSSDKYFWVKVGWTASYRNPTISWQSGAAYPTTYEDYVWIIPILEFSDNTTSSCKELCQSDICLPSVAIPRVDTSGGGLDSSDARKLLSIDASGNIAWDYPRWNSAGPV